MRNNCVSTVVMTDGIAIALALGFVPSSIGWGFPRSRVTSFDSQDPVCLVSPVRGGGFFSADSTVFPPTHTPLSLSLPYTSYGHSFSFTSNRHPHYRVLTLGIVSVFAFFLCFFSPPPLSSLSSFQRTPYTHRERTGKIRITSEWCQLRKRTSSEESEECV